jgi:hypothetical protein
MLGEVEGVDEAIAAADEPYHEIKDKWGEAAEQEQAGFGNVKQALLMPAIRALFQAEARRRALVRSLRILVALDAYRQRTGQDAVGLADLKLPAAAVIDPYSGQPLKLKLTENGWVIYSVMENGIDDGGDFEGLKDWGLRPPGWQLVD